MRARLGELRWIETVTLILLRLSDAATKPGGFNRDNPGCTGYSLGQEPDVKPTPDSNTEYWFAIIPPIDLFKEC